MKHSYITNLIDYFIKIIPKYLIKEIKFKLEDDTIFLQTNKKYITSLIFFLKNH